MCWTDCRLINISGREEGGCSRPNQHIIYAVKRKHRLAAGYIPLTAKQWNTFLSSVPVSSVVTTLASHNR